MLKEEPKRDSCLKFACEMQKCLQNAGYDDSKCAGVLVKLKKCCDDHYGSDSSRQISPTCSGFIFKASSHGKFLNDF